MTVKSKFEKCRTIFNNAATKAGGADKMSRADTIAKFVSQAEATAAGAATYYQKLKSEKPGEHDKKVAARLAKAEAKVIADKAKKDAAKTKTATKATAKAKGKAAGKKKVADAAVAADAKPAAEDAATTSGAAVTA